MLVKSVKIMTSMLSNFSYKILLWEKWLQSPKEQKQQSWECGCFS
jgi:hypothetical protein